ncbi:nucleolar protein 12 [Coccidioides immitis RS]|uniref:Nucleolar protein 12 n=1 Tax=Coccidioides immitis (strain RS) TaxID=246410 RepID=J3KKW4_COCIM|nr:nucleolar protein 12 [Coccidioides immitis RS]EAS36856.3 nucleolar protein 12 [Coccidioides immitis RS]
MGKKSKSKAKEEAAASNAASGETTNNTGFSLLFGTKDATAVDPALASLFANSAGPVKSPEIVKSRQQLSTHRRDEPAEEHGSDGEAELADGDEEMPDAGAERVDDDEDDEEEEEEEEVKEKDAKPDRAEKSQKRKRHEAEDDLEESYMRKIAKEEEKDRKKRAAAKNEKRQRTDESPAVDSEAGSSGPDEQKDDEESESDQEDKGPPPVHESLANTAEAAALEKSNRTVFLGNVSSEAIKSKSSKKALLAHLSSFFPSLPESSTPHKIESIRFRSTAFATAAVPKRAAFAKKDLMDSTTRSTNAYVVYTTAAAARKALSLNGTTVLDRHLRVDSIAHPAPIDHKRCVFVGNLGFVDEEAAASTDDQEKKRKKSATPSDVEEGLWRTFNENAGRVESVRVVRDPSTRVGKGFAYVQFHDQNGVEAALLLDGKKFPPMLPRKLRVVRAKRTAKKRNDSTSTNPNRMGLGRPDPSLKGRAAKLLGRAGAAQLRASAKAEKNKKGSESTAPFVFEGYRATEGKNGSLPEFKVKTKSRGRPKTRSARRAKAFRDAKRKGGK